MSFFRTQGNGTCMQVGEVYDTIGTDYAQSERFDRQISGKVCRKVGKITLKCDYLLNIQSFYVFYQRKYVTLYQEQKKSIMDKDINRIKVVLAEKKRTNKWLAEQLGCAPTTVSKWCTNDCQPTMETYLRIAELLNVELTELVRTKK